MIKLSDIIACTMNGLRDRCVNCAFKRDNVAYGLFMVYVARENDSNRDGYNVNSIGTMKFFEDGSISAWPDGECFLGSQDTLSFNISDPEYLSQLADFWFKQSEFRTSRNFSDLLGWAVNRRKSVK